MKTFLFTILLALIPFTAIAAGFCAATYADNRAVFTPSRDNADATLEPDFRALLARNNIKPELQGCVVADDADQIMKKKMLEIQRLGYTNTIIEW